MDVPREMLVALPGSTGDIYLRHQQVWKVMSPYVKRGADFLYVLVGEHMARVRSEYLDRGVSAPRQGTDFVAALVTGRRRAIDQKITSVPECELGQWLQLLLSEHGMVLQEFGVIRRYQATGLKVDRGQNSRQRIELPITDFSLRVKIANAARADEAWRRGLGRHKRFGFGMLRSASNEAK